jgi:hypothetical protein
VLDTGSAAAVEAAVVVIVIGEAEVAVGLASLVEVEGGVVVVVAAATACSAKAAVEPFLSVFPPSAPTLLSLLIPLLLLLATLLLTVRGTLYTPISLRLLSSWTKMRFWALISCNLSLQKRIMTYYDIFSEHKMSDAYTTHL